MLSTVELNAHVGAVVSPFPPIIQPHPSPQCPLSKPLGCVLQICPGLGALCDHGVGVPEIHERTSFDTHHSELLQSFCGQFQPKEVWTLIMLSHGLWGAKNISRGFSFMSQ